MLSRRLYTYRHHEHGSQSKTPKNPMRECATPALLRAASARRARSHTAPARPDGRASTGSPALESLRSPHSGPPAALLHHCSSIRQPCGGRCPRTSTSAGRMVLTLPAVLGGDSRRAPSARGHVPTRLSISLSGLSLRTGRGNTR